MYTAAMFKSLRRSLSFLKISFLFCIFEYSATIAQADLTLWSDLQPVVQARVNQKQKKMKLKPSEANQFRIFLENLPDSIPEMKSIQNIMPKTTVELLMAANKRGLSLAEAEKMANYLKIVLEAFRFLNITAFDENTSHVIGREWSEIDYSGENMTWQKQKAKYQPYGIDNFKSLDCLKKFIPVEARLSYFKKIYKPQNTEPKLPQK